ncbi:MAG: hypothetical protein KTR27_15135 [Leptolyngbyaceae cyanobacterium MAG.088]|nr:hypothetical protein [Leptolyngbyaceae cyanobacterium MAG.088]
MTDAIEELCAQEAVNSSDNSESALIEKFTSQLLSAKCSVHQNQPWVLVTAKHKSPILLAVYSHLKEQGVLDEWSREFYQVREHSGICVFALMP